MELKHIKQETCQICGARAIMQKQDHKHINGHWHEVVKFECESELEYIPNFREIRVIKLCSKSPEAIELERKRMIAKERLKNYIKRLDVDKEWKSSALLYIPR